MTKLYAWDGCTATYSMGQKRPHRCVHGALFGPPQKVAAKGRKPRKRSEANRDWTDARTKVDLEARCRKCHAEQLHLEAAHLVGRKHDGPHPDGTKRLWVNPDRIVPLCPDCHRVYDSHQLDLLGHLSVEEQLRAVSDCGSLEIARRRLAPSAYVEALS